MSATIPAERVDADGAPPGSTGEPPAEGEQKKWQNLGTLWTFIKPHRYTVLLGMVLGLLTTSMTLATPMVARSVLDGLATSEPIGGSVTLLISLMLLGAVTGVFQYTLLGKLAETIVLATRTSMIRQLFRLTIGQFTRRPTGELTTRVTSDTVLLRDAASSSAVQLLNGIVGLVGALVLMALLDPVLLLACFIALIAVGVVIGLLMPKLAKAQQTAQESIGKLGGRLEVALRAIRTVKTSRAEDRESDLVIGHAQDSATHNIRAVRIGAIANTATQTGIDLAIIIILALGTYRVGIGAISVPTLIAFLLYAFQLLEPLTTLTHTITQLQSGVVSAARIREIQELEVERHDAGEKAAPATTTSITGKTPVVSLREVSARYLPSGPPAVDDVSIDIPRIGHTAIVGPSGAGKTTIFSLVLGFLQPERGELLLDGVPYDQWSLHSLRERIVYVEQDTPLLPGTLRENLLYTYPDADEDAIWRALEAVRLGERARDLENGLDTELSASSMSGGERQRIALARALVGDPTILLLDEATAQLDGLTESAVQDGIRRTAERGAVVTIAHRLSTVIDADCILVMENGRCRARGTHAELLRTDQLYRELVSALRISDGNEVSAAG
ncbi:ABC transporter ATP-binding protein [Amycolatopsis sp. CA-230715]|uniref:ABC transporter ATP-binding protein n=1 Tax=Amycolatopsis sp. CA-230715 TaxID=2745196 RepID=UPI001C028F5B|nr:ABC transporter ATP-binding protein [Amycolatopsis sp. CA-230715]QWF78559.1 Multidrug resistance ABC transporter ATP-binding/permease protein BmrA [Amycolatopsis sp. CA-230715]